MRFAWCVVLVVVAVGVATEPEPDTCTDEHNCLIMDLALWISQLTERKSEDSLCPVGSAGAGSEDPGAPIFSMAQKCQDPGATWKYRYQGAKGKKRIFHGKGKLSFSKLSSPPHGFDYGMKSGLCLIISSEVESIEGTFVNGIPHGDADISYINGRLDRVFLEQGVPNGLCRSFEPEMDKETGREKPEKRLAEVKFVHQGQKGGSRWAFQENGVKIFHPAAGGDLGLVIVADVNETKVIYGHLDGDDMMSKAKMAKLTGLESTQCLQVPQFEPYGETFDYDLQVKAKAKATVAKLLRFFEIVADEKQSLDKTFDVDPEPVTSARAKIMFKVDRKREEYYEVTTLEGSGKAIYEGSKQDETISGFGTIKMLSTYQRRDVMPPTNESNPANVTMTGGMSMEQYLNEYLPYAALPFRSIVNPKLSSIHGKFHNGVLQGLATLTFTDASSWEGMVKDNCFHGVVRHLDRPFSKGRRKRYIRRFVEDVMLSGSTMSKEEPISEVTFIGHYKNGFIDGPGWQFLVGGAFLFGDFQKTSTFTTEQGAYVNQDLESAYVGHFKEGRMAAGQVALVIGHEVKDGITIPLFGEPSGSVYKFITQDDSGDLVDPLVTDITEDTWVEVRPSLLGVLAGEGLFAKQDIPPNTVVAFFGGLRQDAQKWNQTKPVDPEYWIKVSELEVIYLPEKYGRDTQKYQATLGHKINHSFSHWNCLFHVMDHPRFGTIPAARTAEKVAEGSELLCLYEIKFHEGAPWFQELWRSELDFDTPIGPLGHRGEKSPEKEDISVMLTNATLFQEFYDHAIHVLHLDPVT